MTNEDVIHFLCAAELSNAHAKRRRDYCEIQGEK